MKRLAGNHFLWLPFGLWLLMSSCSGNFRDTGSMSPQFVVINNNVNNFYGAKKPPNAIIRYLDSSFRLIRQPFMQDKFRFYSFHFVYEKRTKHDLKKTLLYADSMLMIAKASVTKHQYQINYAEANFASGDAYFDLSQFSEAYKCYYQGYHIGKNLLNNQILAQYTYRMGMVTFKQAHYIKSANYFKISFTQNDSNPNNFLSFYQRQELLTNIGESYKNAGQTDSASAYFVKALNFININGKRFGKAANMIDIANAVVYGNQGDIALRKQNYIQAEQLLKQSIAINLKKGNDNRDAQLTEIKLSRLYANLNRNDDLFILLKNLRHQLDSVNNNEAETNWNYFMSRYYLKQNDHIKALWYLKTYSSLKDSVIKLANTLRHTDVNQQQANFDRQGEINTLKNYNKLQLVYIYLAVLLSIMAVIIIFLVIRNLNRSKNDVIAVKELNDQINSQKENLERTLNELSIGSREKDRILRAVAHDLRNPLGGIASLSGLMITEDSTADQLDMINLIKDTSYNSLELINEILEAANTANAKFNKELVDINLLLSNSVELLRFNAAAKNQKITLQTPDYPMELQINREKIWRVISNLISNAVKFSHNGSDINVCVKNDDNGVEISVKDNGIGIPYKLQAQVFNMFTNAKRIGTSGEKSFGLGLSICRQIVDKHEGKIWFESDTETGTTFYVFLPFEAEPVSLAAVF